MAADVPVIFARWEQFLHWLLQRTAKFPRRVRFTLTNRIDNLALDIFEGLVEARYSRERLPLLTRLNLNLERLRLLLRLSYDQQMLDPRAFANACESMDEVGRMLGGWLKQQRERE